MVRETLGVTGTEVTPLPEGEGLTAMGGVGAAVVGPFFGATDPLELPRLTTTRWSRSKHDIW